MELESRILEGQRFPGGKRKGGGEAGKWRLNLDDAFGQHSPSTRFLVPIQRFFNNSFLPTGTQSFGRNLKNFKVSRSVFPGAVISTPPPPSINHRSEIIRQLAPGFSARIPRSGGVRRIVTHFARLGASNGS